MAQAVLGEGKVTVTGIYVPEGAGLRVRALFFKGGEGHPETLAPPPESADGRGGWLRPWRCGFRSESRNLTAGYGMGSGGKYRVPSMEVLFSARPSGSWR